MKAIQIFFLTSVIHFAISFLPVWDNEDEDLAWAVKRETYCAITIVFVTSLVTIGVLCFSRKNKKILKHILVIQMVTYSVLYLPITYFVLNWEITVNYSLPLLIYITCQYM